MIMKGQKINDRYQIIKSIGEGGMANVYLAYDTILDRNVAVKVLRGDLSTDDKFVRRFQREALSASSLSHPNIVEVYDVGEDNGQFYIVMEYIEGKQLKDVLRKRGKLTISEVIDIMQQIADGLSVAHDSYIIHRDIKPQNIMILENGLVKITDFGIAMAMNGTQLTQTNSVMGSVHYLPPEQANGSGSTLKSDIYSMGILMYELLTGKLPYRGENAVEIALKHLKEPLPSIRDEIPDIPQSVENVILKASAKNPKNRYSDAREMYEDLKTVLDESRENEPRLEYEYPEMDYDERSKKTKEKEKKVEEKTEIIDEDDIVIAKQITNKEINKQNKLLMVLAIIFTSLVVIITCFVVLLPKLTSRDEIKVPDVSEKSVSEAIEILQDAGFEVADEQKEISDDEIPEGKVVKTNPAAEAKRTKGTEITLYVSTGDNSYVVEDFVKDKANYLTVQGKLEAYGIYVRVEKKEVEDKDKYKDGQIIEQSVEPGEKLSAKDTIVLYIPNVVTKYPDFSELSVEEVEEFCKEYEIELSIEKGTPADVEVGKIYYQYPPKGYTVLAGQKLKIKVAVSSEENPEGPTEDECESTGLC
ncbi:MAG: Stk1 family PASTA domain-containing Ser/Thr kinase [Bacilli bacterium]